MRDYYQINKLGTTWELISLSFLVTGLLTWLIAVY